MTLHIQGPECGLKSVISNVNLDGSKLFKSDIEDEFGLDSDGLRELGYTKNYDEAIVKTADEWAEIELAEYMAAHHVEPGAAEVAATR